MPTFSRQHLQIDWLKGEEYIVNSLRLEAARALEMLDKPSFVPLFRAIFGFCYLSW